VKLGGSESGGTAVAQQTLGRLGASSSTYTGDYRVGTVIHIHQATCGAPDPPPVVSSRVTTARDLATILRTLTRAAFGATDALRATRAAHGRLPLGPSNQSEVERTGPSASTAPGRTPPSRSKN